MAKTSSQVTTIGFFVLIGTALLVAMLIAFGGNSWFKETATYTMRFNSSVRGLSAGSAVMFRGVNIGQVKNIRLQSPEDPDNRPVTAAENSSTVQFPVLVTVEIDPEKLGFQKHSWWEMATGQSIWHNSKEELEVYLADMVLEQGLRAELQTASLLTGQLCIEMTFDAAAAENDSQDELRKSLQENIFPTKLGFFDQMSSKFGAKRFRNRVESIQRLIDQCTDFIDSGRCKTLMDDLALVAANLRTTTDTLNQRLPPLLDDTQHTVTDAKELVGNVNQKLDPLIGHANLLITRMTLVGEAARMLLGTVNNIATNSQPKVEEILGKVSTSLDEAQLTLEDTRASLNTAHDIIAPNSPSRQRLEKTINDCQDTINSLRVLLENLNRNPQMLLKGE